MILFPTLTMYSIVKIYVTINNKENTASTLLSIIFLQTRSHFIVFDFTMKSLQIVVFYFRWWMLVDSLTFKVSSLPPWKKKKWKLRSLKKRAISKTSINDVVSVNFQIVYKALKIVKTKIRKQKLWFLLLILFYSLTIWYYSSSRVM